MAFTLAFVVVWFSMVFVIGRLVRRQRDLRRMALESEGSPLTTSTSGPTGFDTQTERVVFDGQAEIEVTVSIVPVYEQRVCGMACDECEIQMLQPCCLVAGHDERRMGDHLCEHHRQRDAEKRARQPVGPLGLIIPPKEVQ